jgi:hypothetical protein
MQVIGVFIYIYNIMYRFIKLPTGVDGMCTCIVHDEVR